LVAGGFDFQREADRLLLARFTPPSVLVNDRLDIVQFRGHTGPFLEPAQGAASLNVLKMAREGLLPDLRAAINDAKTSGLAVSRLGVKVRTDGALRVVNVEVIPLKPSSTDRPTCFIVLFEEITGTATPARATKSAAAEKPARGRRTTDERPLEQLRQELSATKSYLQSVIEEHERTNEGLQSAGEEILSSNEELQSTNEELETAKEELQSANEELRTLNDELQTRNAELGQLNDDHLNLLNSIQTPILMLTSDLRIHRFTPQAERILNLVSSDIGRPLSDLGSRIPVPELEQLARDVMETLAPKELELRDREGRWCTLRLRPYKTIDQRINGVVIALLDIDALKRSLLEARAAQELAEAIVATVHEPILLLDADLRVNMANDAFYRTFRAKREETERHRLDGLGAGRWNSPRLLVLLEEILPKNTRFDGFDIELDLPGVGPKHFLLNARRLARATDQAPLILLAMEAKP
jgi:two-component system CheB/CheR fusion protein